MLFKSSSSFMAMTAFLGLVCATPDPVAAAAATTTTGQPGCPSAIAITNGGFETGKITPWSLAGNTTPNVKQKIVSPGSANSKYALQVDFPPANISEYTLTTGTTGQECFGYYYNISYSWNWAKYTGPEGKGSSYCAFSAGTGYTDGVVNHYATRTPGWHHFSYIGRDVYSHGKPAYGSYFADVTCVGGEDESIVLPGFTILIDNFSITNAPGNPNAPIS